MQTRVCATSFCLLYTDKQKRCVCQNSQVHFTTMNVCKIAAYVANNVEPDQMPHSVASDQWLHCLLRPVFQYMWSKYSNLIKSNPSEIILDPPLCFYGELQMILFISSLCCGYSLEDPRRTFPIITHNLSMENWRKLSPNTRLTNLRSSRGPVFYL